MAPSQRGVLLQTCSMGPQSEELRREGWVGGGRPFETLKTSRAFHFLNLKHIAVCGIHWSVMGFFFLILSSSSAKLVDPTKD